MKESISDTQDISFLHCTFMKLFSHLANLSNTINMHVICLTLPIKYFQNSLCLHVASIKKHVTGVSVCGGFGWLCRLVKSVVCFYGYDIVCVSFLNTLLITAMKGPTVFPLLIILKNKKSQQGMH